MTASTLNLLLGVSPSPGRLRYYPFQQSRFMLLPIVTEVCVGVGARMLTFIYIWKVNLCQAFNSVTRPWTSQDHIGSYPELSHSKEVYRRQPTQWLACRPGVLLPKQGADSRGINSSGGTLREEEKRPQHLFQEVIRKQERGVWEREPEWAEEL
ncbi:Hypothetical predicted protein [Marmota monax]|uniref:Uncharacterized protein n=1 Tax=Marmota monax TaxID=9995 RepID=A0A5E4BN31_MARMO|nr:Hypothetical predicted protein [Marmota monax]